MGTKAIIKLNEDFFTRYSSNATAFSESILTNELLEVELDDEGDIIIDINSNEPLLNYVLYEEGLVSQLSILHDEFTVIMEVPYEES